jgi:hypothetical protein
MCLASTRQRIRRRIQHTKASLREGGSSPPSAAFAADEAGMGAQPHARSFVYRRQFTAGPGLISHLSSIFASKLTAKGAIFNMFFTDFMLSFHFLNSASPGHSCFT